MSGSILLHKEKGVNPYLVQCRICGGEVNELVLVGAKDSIYKCDSCGINVIGGISASSPCPSCKCSNGTFVRKLESGEKIPGLCDNCKKVLDSGGVLMIEVRDGEKGENPYRTGYLIGVKKR